MGKRHLLRTTAVLGDGRICSSFLNQPPAEFFRLLLCELLHGFLMEVSLISSLNVISSMA